MHEEFNAGVLKLGADGKTDAIAGCTIGVSGLLKAAVKAAETT